MTSPFKGKATSSGQLPGSPERACEPYAPASPHGVPVHNSSSMGPDRSGLRRASTLKSAEGSPWSSRTAGGIPGLSPNSPPHLLCRGRWGSQ